MLLRVPQYDFNWQHTYEFSEPLPFSEVESLELTTTFDNSQSNPFNPAPDEYVVWGDQTWEEMSVAFLEVARPLHGQSSATDTASVAKKEVSKTASIEPAISEADAKFADDFLSKFDANGDGRGDL